MLKSTIKTSLLLVPILLVIFLSFRFKHGSTAFPRPSMGQVAGSSTLQPRTASIVAVKPFQESAAGKQEAKESQKELHSVARVIDGDTIVVNMNGSTSSLQAGAETHIRLIGVDSLELNDKRPRVACFARKAKDEAEKLLNGKKVYLEKDLSQGEYDKYGRLLAYVFTESGTFFNKAMIEEGYAYEYTYRLPYKYQTEFKETERTARMFQKGLWNQTICNEKLQQ